MDAIDRFGDALVQAGRRRYRRRWPLSALSSAAGLHAPGPLRTVVRARVALLALVLLLALTAIGLAAGGVILTGAAVRPAVTPIATAGEGLPIPGGSRLLALRAADPAGGLPWGMRIVRTTRGLLCVQIGRVQSGQLGQLGVDGAFANDGRFHPLPASVLPDNQVDNEGWFSGNCAAPEETYAGDIVGLQLNAARNPRAGRGAAVDRREISFGLLGKHAVSITYRVGGQTHTQRVLAGLGAYLIVQRYTSGKQVGSISETIGRDEPGNYSAPAAPNGALTRILYSYAGRPCIDTGGGPRLASCGLSETPPPRPAQLAAVHVAIHAHLHIDGHVISSAEISFRAPYPVTSANQSYSTTSSICHGLAGSGSHADIAAGATVTLPIGDLLSLSQPCRRSVTIKVEYVRFIRGLPEPTPIGTVTVTEPPGTHAAPVRRPR